MTDRFHRRYDNAFPVAKDPPNSMGGKNPNHIPRWSHVINNCVVLCFRRLGYSDLLPPLQSGPVLFGAGFRCVWHLFHLYETFTLMRGAIGALLGVRRDGPQLSATHHSAFPKYPWAILPTGSTVMRR
jgi:hypothetical protein